MNVMVNYKGRFGNNLFQYCAARLFASKHGGAMRGTMPDNGIVIPVDRRWPYSPLGRYTYRITTPEAAAGPAPQNNHDCVFDGWFQDASLYMPHRETIKRWFWMPDVERNDDDIAVHVRLTDYYTSWADGSRVIAPEWYHSILARERFGRVHVFADDYSDPYLKTFRRYGKCIMPGSAYNDFHMLRSFSRMIMSNSTFAWWAWFLGHGAEAYVFKPWVADPQVRLVHFPGSVPVSGEFHEPPRGGCCTHADEQAGT